MSDPERVLMQATAKGMAMEPGRPDGTGSRDTLTVEDVGYAMAGMRAQGVPEPVRKRVEAALHFVVLGDQEARWDCYRELVAQGRRSIEKGRWPDRIGGRLYLEPLSTLAIYANEIPPLDLHLSGQESPSWSREFAPRYRELRESLRQWVSIGMGHVRRRTEEDE